jgi:ABC-type nitrate/sulfonate/bicarbonate transport system permease component
MERYFHYLASTPKVVFLPLVFILFGIGPVSKIALGAFACSFPLTLGIASAIRQVPSVYIRVAKGFDLSLWQMAWMVYLPSLAPAVMTGLRIALGIAFSACLVAEMKFANIGVGSLIVRSYEHSRFADVYALLIVVTGSAIAATALLGRLGRQQARRPAR